MARILVIDDEANIRMMLRMALEKDGHTVAQAGDGPDGLDKFGDGSAWDLVLLDQRMPGMEGLEVLRQIRLRQANARVIMISAFGTVELASESMTQGAIDFLRKPFTLNTLRGAVNSAVEGRTGAWMADASIPYSTATLNGFRIESRRHTGERTGTDTAYHFSVCSPSGESVACRVMLPAAVAEMVREQTGPAQIPDDAPFWRSLCEEALANYIWQNAGPPPDGALRVEEFPSGLHRWAEAFLAHLE